jgi:hypothetical protein
MKMTATADLDATWRRIFTAPTSRRRSAFGALLALIVYQSSLIVIHYSFVAPLYAVRGVR